MTVLAVAGHATAKGAAIGTVVVAAVVVELMACVGVLIMPNVNDRLHFVTPASSVGPVLTAIALLAKESVDHQGIVTVLIALFLLVFGPVITHATARAARVRASGTWRERPDAEKVHRP